MGKYSCRYSGRFYLRPLFFLIYTNDLAEKLFSYLKLFVDDTCLFSVVWNEYLCKWNLCQLEKYWGLGSSMENEFQIRSVEAGTRYYKPDFDENIKGVFRKNSKSFGLSRKLRNFLPRPSYLQIYKSLATPYLVYGDINYDQAVIGSFQ